LPPATRKRRWTAQPATSVIDSIADKKVIHKNTRRATRAGSRRNQVNGLIVDGAG
jgi:ribosomal protein S20